MPTEVKAIIFFFLVWGFLMAMVTHQARKNNKLIQRQNFYRGIKPKSKRYRFSWFRRRAQSDDDSVQMIGEMHGT